METMRAGNFLAPGNITFEERAEKPAMQEGHLLVRTHLASICGSDLHTVFHGVLRQPFPHPPGFPGHEGTGEVLESLHPDFKKGDHVLTCPSPGVAATFAEYQVIDGNYCLKLPPYDGPEAHLLMAQQLGTVIFALRQCPQDLVGKTVMVQGQGSAGMFFAYLAKRAGAAKVIVSDLSEARLAASAGMGADVAVRVGGDNVLQAVMDHTGGQGADFLVEAVGSRESLLEAVSLARLGADMLMFGLPDSTSPVPYNFHDFFRKKLRMVSTYGTQEEPGRVSFQMALNLIANKEVDVSPLVKDFFPIEEVNTAMAAANDRGNNMLKVSLTFD